MQNIAEEFKTEIARITVLYVQEIYNEVYLDLEDDFLKEDLKSYHDEAMSYAREPIAQRTDELVEALRGDNCYLRHLHSYITMFYPQKLSRFYVSARNAITDTFTKRTIHEDIDNVAENVRVWKEIFNEIHFMRNF